MTSSMKVPLIGLKSDDPFYAFKDEIKNRVNEVQDRFSKWKINLNTDDATDTKRETTQLATDLKNLQVGF